MSWSDLPDGVADHLLPLLTELDAGLLRCVCRSWRQSFDFKQIEALIEERFHSKYQRRLKKRESLTSEMQDELDTQLSNTVLNGANSLDSWIKSKSEIVELLDQGATEAIIPAHQFSEGNVCEIVDAIDQWQHCPFDCEGKTIPSITNGHNRIVQMLSLIDEIVASPSDSPVFCGRHVYNDGCELSRFIANYALIGNIWGRRRYVCHCFKKRYAAWHTCKLMVLREDLIRWSIDQWQPRKKWLYLTGAHFDYDPAHSNRTDQLIWNQCIRELLAINNGAWLWDMIRLSLKLDLEYPRFNVFRYFLARSLFETADSALKILNSFQWQQWVSSREIVSVLNILLADRIQRKRVLETLRRHQDWRKIVVRHPIIMQELCRRKERQVFELLLRLESEDTRRYAVPRALELLKQSNPPFVRGKKERLIELLENIKKRRDH